MAERTYKMPSNPEYHEDITQLNRHDPADAVSVFNPLFQAMLENTHFVKLLAQAIAEQNASDHAAIRRETAERISAAVEAIPTPDVSGQIGVHNTSDSAHTEKFNALTTQIEAAKAGAVPITRKVNNRALSSDINLTASDVSALPTSGGTVSGDVTITGDLRLKGSGNYGNKINLGDGDYVHLSEPTDDCLEIKAKKVNFVLSDTSTSQLTVNGSPIGGAVVGTDYTTYRARQIALVSSVPSSLSNGQIALVYV